MILLPNFTFRVTFHFVSFRIHKRKKKTLFFFYLTLVLLTISYYNSKLNSTNIKKKTVKFFLLVFQICNSHSQQLIIINIHNLELIFITSIAIFFCLTHFPIDGKSAFVTLQKDDTSTDPKRKTTPVEIPRRAYGKRPATVTSIGTRSRIYCNPSGVEYSRKILKVQTVVRGIQGPREFREHGTPWRVRPFPPLWPSKFWHGRDIVRTFLQGMPQRANHPSPPALETRTFAPCISEKPRAPL